MSPLVLLFAAIAVTFALVTWHGAWQRGKRLEVTRHHLARKAAAERQLDSITDEEVRLVWPAICDAIAHGELASASAVSDAAARLGRGVGVQLMEETFIDLDDEVPEEDDRALVYHAGMSPARRTCPRAALVRELERLAAALVSPEGRRP